MLDQNRRFGMSAQAVKSAEFEDPDHDVHTNIHKGRFQLLYISPEFKIRNLAWREMLRTAVYTKNLIVFVV